MNSYNVVIDDSMIRNMIQTNIDESLDLVTLKQILYLIFLGLIPAYFVYKIDIEYKNIKTEIFQKLKILLISLLIILASILMFNKHYTSFAREHKPLRYSTNPTYWIYSIAKYINSTYNSTPIIAKPIGLDAEVLDAEDKRKKIVVMVVGEAARADHFSLNGYSKQTNPLLQQEDIINLSNTYSCGTSTAASVPCMFSILTKNQYSYKKGLALQNVLDLISHTKKIAVLWRDNNSDSKGVALRVPYENFKLENKNQICKDGECRDEGMLLGLDEFIKKNKSKDILIILHQMGNHGPAYYKRYPKEFEKFKPVCKTNQLEQCTKEEISNAYDNAILYTDYFLSKTINFLKKYDTSYDTAMIYMSDHGESLGENGIYLHGLPYFMAPDAQIHIGTILWFNNDFYKKLNLDNLRKNTNKRFSHDNLFHTLLGIFNIKTSIYNKNLNIVAKTE